MDYEAIINTAQRCADMSIDCQDCRYRLSEDCGDELGHDMLIAIRALIARAEKAEAERDAYCAEEAAGNLIRLPTRIGRYVLKNTNEAPAEAVRGDLCLFEYKSEEIAANEVERCKQASQKQNEIIIV